MLSLLLKDLLITVNQKKRVTVHEAFSTCSPPCPQCGIKTEVCGEEGWICEWCPKLFHICDECADDGQLVYLDLINWCDAYDKEVQERPNEMFYDLTRTWPTAHINQPIVIWSYWTDEKASDGRRFATIDDSTSLLWECECCMRLLNTSCD
jgi:hypothetical protein